MVRYVSTLTDIYLFFTTIRLILWEFSKRCIIVFFVMHRELFISIITFHVFTIKVFENFAPYSLIHRAVHHFGI